MTDQYDRLQQVAGPVSRETFDRLKALEASFLSWARRINLAAESTLGDVWDRHILDSAQILPLAPGARRWLDLGSGGGFPGLVIAILLKERGGSIDLVESNRKKAGFLQAMAGQFDLPARIHARRIEEMDGLEGVEIVTARALAPLPLLIRLAGLWLAGGAVGLFHKGRDYRSELENSAAPSGFDLIEHRSKVDAAGFVVEVRRRSS